jgi:hypothetical protein
MILQLVGLVVLVSLVVAGVIYFGKNVRFGEDKSKSLDEKEMK